MFAYRIFIVFALVINAVCLQAASIVNRWKLIKDITTPEAYCMASVAQIGDNSAVHIAGSTLSDVFLGNYSASLHRYDATTRSFKKYNVSLPTGRFAPTVVTVGKKVYIIGGGVMVIAPDTSTSLKYLDDMYEFDPIKSTLDNVTVVGLAPIPMIYGSAAEIDDDQFVYFSGEGPYLEARSSDIWSFNVKSKQWTIQGKMPSIPMGSNAAVTLHDHFGIGKHGVFLLGGSADISIPRRSYDNRAWILNPESWKIEELPTDDSSGALPWGESHKLTTEKIQGGTRVWAFSAQNTGNFDKGSNTFQFLDIPAGAGSSGPNICWQLLPIVNPDSDLAAPESHSASYMLHRQAGMNSEPHILGACYPLDMDTPYFANKIYSVARNDPGANGAQSLLYVDTNHSKDGDTITIQAGEQVDFRLVAYDADGEQLDYGKIPVTSFLNHPASQQRVFATIHNMQNGSWYLSYTPETAGTWTLEVFLNGEVVNNRTKIESPINLNVIPSPPVANRIKLIGNGVTNPTAGTWSVFTIQLKDTYNNTVLRKATESANISVTIIPNFSLPDESTSSPIYYTSEITDTGIEIMYRVNHTGSYKISTFMGDKIIVSSIDVNVVRDPIVSLDPPASMNINLGSPEAFACILLFSLSMVGVILCGGCMIGMIVYKNENIIKAIDVTASLICLSGLMILFGSGFFWSFRPTIASCSMWPFFHSIGFGVVFSTLAGKIWHVYTIFTTRNMQKISKWKSIVFQGSIILIDLILCLTWSLVDPLRPAVKYPGTYFAHEDCSSSSETRQKLFLGLIGGFNGLLGIIGLVVAYQTRNLPSRYNQTAHVAISMESFIILLLFVLPALDFMDKYLVPKNIVRFLVTWVPAMITTVLLFGSRVYIASTTSRKPKSKISLPITNSKSSESQGPNFVKYIATTKNTEMPGEAVRMDYFKVYWCKEQRLRPKIWFKSTMIVVPTIGILTFTDHDYPDAHMIVDIMNAKLERIPANMDFQYMLRLRTQKNGAYLIGAFSSSDLDMIEPLIKMLIANNVDCLHLPDEGRTCAFARPR